jgi:hypothetical protein
VHPWSVARALAVASLLAACGGQCPQAAAPAAVCAKNRIPVGRWTGDWESYPLDNPNFLRSGTIDLVIGEGGAITGQTVEEGENDRGTIAGKVAPSGEFDGDYSVQRDSGAARYTMKGSFVCEADGIGGMGVVRWAEKSQGNLKFKLQKAP